MTNPSLGSLQQYNHRAAGPAGSDAVEGYGKLTFSASGNSGLVATCYGLRGLSAERVSTGIYQLNFPIANGCILQPSLEAPSGYHYDVAVVAKTSISGMAQIHIGQANATTGVFTHLSPRSGTHVLLRFSFHPRVVF